MRALASFLAVPPPVKRREIFLKIKKVSISQKSKKILNRDTRLSNNFRDQFSGHIPTVHCDSGYFLCYRVLEPNMAA